MAKRVGVAKRLAATGAARRLVADDVPNLPTRRTVHHLVYAKAFHHEPVACAATYEAARKYADAKHPEGLVTLRISHGGGMTPNPCPICWRHEK